MVLKDACTVAVTERDTVRQCGLPKDALIHQSRFGHTFINEDPMNTEVPEGGGRVFCYTPLDKQVYVYNFTDEELYESVLTFHLDIWFYLSDEEATEFLDYKMGDNLKNDFVYFRPGLNRYHIMQCTCGNFLEHDKSIDKLAKLAVRHFERTGHTLNPRGN